MNANHDNPEVLGENESLGRRRLVRGVMSIAPVVLTLRSGGLAAASCVPAKTVDVTLGDHGKIPASVLAVEGDVCYKRLDVGVCPSPDRPNALDKPAESPANSYRVTASRDGRSLRCGSGDNKLPQNTRVAILSSGAATSFLA